MEICVNHIYSLLSINEALFVVVLETYLQRCRENTFFFVFTVVIYVNQLAFAALKGIIIVSTIMTLVIINLSLFSVRKLNNKPE